jgi:heptosyltransferase-2
MPNWIGDLVLALAVVNEKNRQSRERLELLVPAGLVELTKLLSPLPVIAYRRAGRREVRETLREVRTRSFNRLYILPFSFSSGWFAFRTGIPVRRGLSRDGRGILLTQRLSGKVRDVSRHITVEYAAILDIPPRDPLELEGTRLKPPAEHAGKVVLCPGAKYGAAKRWEGFAGLAEALAPDPIVVVGSQAEAEAAARVARTAPGRVADLSGDTSLTDVARILAGASVVVSNDSGLMHLAAYLGVPTVGIFGSTTPVWTRPIGRTAETISSSAECSPCFDRRCRFDHYRCLHDITVRQVHEKCRALMRRDERVATRDGDRQ